MAPSAGIEPAAYRLGGGRSIRLSYEGEGGALCGALLATTIVPLSRLPVGFIWPFETGCLGVIGPSEQRRTGQIFTRVRCLVDAMGHCRTRKNCF